MISVILITYNGALYVEKAIQSVINQTIDKSMLQLIIVDDNSLDNTVEIAKNYEEMYPDNIIIVQKQINTSIARDSSRDIGIEYSDGEYIMFLDQDDWYLPNAFDTLHKLMDEDENLDYIEYSFNYVDEHGMILRQHRGGRTGYRKCDIVSERDRINLEINKLLPCSSFVWSKIYRKSFLQKYDIHHNMGEQYCGFGDNYFSGLVELNCTHFAYYYEPLMCYFVRNGSWSHAKKINDVNQLERIKVGMVLHDECIRRGYDKSKPEVMEYILFRVIYEKVFWKLLLGFEPIPFDILITLKEYIMMRFPNYKKNPLLKNRKQLEPLLYLLDFEWTPEFLNEIGRENK